MSYRKEFNSQDYLSFSLYWMFWSSITLRDNFRNFPFTRDALINFRCSIFILSWRTISSCFHKYCLQSEAWFSPLKCCSNCGSSNLWETCEREWAGGGWGRDGRTHDRSSASVKIVYLYINNLSNSFLCVCVSIFKAAHFILYNQKEKGDN